MLLSQTVTSLILLSFSRCLTSSGGSSRVHSAPKIAFKPCHSLVTGISSTLLFAVTTVTSSIKEGVKFNKINSYGAVTATTKNTVTVTLVLQVVTLKMLQQKQAVTLL